MSVCGERGRGWGMGMEEDGSYFIIMNCQLTDHHHVVLAGSGFCLGASLSPCSRGTCPVTHVHARFSQSGGVLVTVKARVRNPIAWNIVIIHQRTEAIPVISRARHSQVQRTQGSNALQISTSQQCYLYILEKPLGTKQNTPASCN